MPSKYFNGLKSKILNNRKEHINSVPSPTTFYLITKHKCNDFAPDSFNFKFGITINPKERMESHKCFWGAVYSNSIFITCSDPNFSKSYEYYLKNISGSYKASEYRKGMSEYNSICKELLYLSKEKQDLNLKFYIHRDYNLYSDIKILSKHYYNQHFFSEANQVLSMKSFFYANLTYLKQVVSFSTINKQHI